MVHFGVVIQALGVIFLLSSTILKQWGTAGGVFLAILSCLRLSCHLPPKIMSYWILVQEKKIPGKTDNFLKIMLHCKFQTYVGAFFTWELFREIKWLIFIKVGMHDQGQMVHKFGPQSYILLRVGGPLKCCDWEKRIKPVNRCKTPVYHDQAGGLGPKLALQ